MGRKRKDPLLKKESFSVSLPKWMVIKLKDMDKPSNIIEDLLRKHIFKK